MVCNYFSPSKLSTTVVGGMRVDSSILHEINSRLNISQVNTSREQFAACQRQI